MGFRQKIMPSMEEANNVSDTAENQDDLELEEILRKINRVRELAKIMETTVDREEFYCSLFESKIFY